MSETTQKFRNRVREVYGDKHSRMAKDFIALTNDADHLAVIEQEVQSLADLFEQEWLRSGKTDRVSRSLADKLRAILDPEGS